MACWDRAQARHGLVGGFDAHITSSRLRQTISVFCSPGDRTRVPPWAYLPDLAGRNEKDIDHGAAGIAECELDYYDLYRRQSVEIAAVEEAEMIGPPPPRPASSAAIARERSVFVVSSCT